MSVLERKIQLIKFRSLPSRKWLSVNLGVLKRKENKASHFVHIIIIYIYGEKKNYKK